MKHLKTVILSHAYHHLGENWEDVEWGSPAEGRYGRIPMAILKALEFDAELIIFPSGVTVDEVRTEADLRHNYAAEHLAELESLPEFKLTEGTLAEWFVQHSRMERSSQNTRDEVKEALHIMEPLGVERMIIVSSPEHVMRCHKTALSVLAEQSCTTLLRELFATASDTHFKNASVDDVLIIEPLHRGDMDKVPFNQTLEPILKVLRDPERSWKLNDALATVIRAQVPESGL